MKQCLELRTDVENGALDKRLTAIYGGAKEDLPHLRARLIRVLDDFVDVFGQNSEVGLFSGPGRTEMGGNHTDHQHGCVLAAAVELDAIACAGRSNDNCICIRSVGYPPIEIQLDSLSPREEERGSSAALVRGVAARFVELGYPIGGFQACIQSNVLSGSGLSSSAAYEILLGVILNHLFCADKVHPVSLAQIGQYAENVYFGKPCGLMDQLASSVGSIVAIDFRSSEEPVVRKIGGGCAPSLFGYALCILDSGADHADLTEEYAAIPAEMGAVAAFFGESVLREVEPETFWAQLPALRRKVGDRAILRAIHFFNDNALAQQQALALAQADFAGFLSLVRQSGASSAEYLQNLYSTSAPTVQPMVLAIAAAQHLLGENGAVRVHGGGFAGTVQAYVPLEKLTEFKKGIETILGAGSCHVLRIRPEGGTVIAG